MKSSVINVRTVAGLSPIEQRRRQSQFGFTLVELMITVAIMGILAAIALPSYQSTIRKARRTDAVLSLQQIQMEQEKLRANCTTYAATLTGTRGCGVLGFPSATSAEAYYALAITPGSATDTGFIATATAITGKSQASDTGCTTITLSVSGLTLTKTPTECWSK